MYNYQQAHVRKEQWKVETVEEVRVKYRLGQKSEATNSWL